jgi:hypothetical protein
MAEIPGPGPIYLPNPLPNHPGALSTIQSLQLR